MNDRLATGQRIEADRQRCQSLLSILDAVKRDPSADAARIALDALNELSGMGDVPSAEVTERLLSVARERYYTNDTTSAVRASSLALRLARQLGDHSLRRKALTIHGAICRVRGDDAAAVEAYLEAIDAARLASDAAQEAPVWNNVGIVLHHRGQSVEALHCFAKAAEGATGDVAFVAAQAHVNSALSHMDLNDTSSGIAAAQRAIALSESPSETMSIVTRGIAEATLARLLLKAGQLEDATRHAAASEDFHMKAPTHLTSIETEITRSLIEIASNNVEGGAVRLSAALARCRRENPSELRDALVAAVDGFENAGQADVALTYLHELLALNRDSVTHKLLERLRAVAEVAPGAKPDPAATAKAIALATAVDNAISDLVNAAVTASEQAGHDRLRIFRVGRLAELLAGEIGWGAERAAALAFAARLANLGLLVIPDALLRKPRGLSGAERRIVNEHTEFGADLLRKSRLAILQPAVQVAKFHHERWDGNGPWALAGDAIPIEARLTAIADCFDALTHPRPWREAYSVQDGLRFIAEGAGTQFDPSPASCFVGMVRRIFWDHSDFDKWLSQEGQENSYVQARAQLERLIRGDSETFRATAAVHSGHGMGRSDATDGGPSRFGP